MAIHAAPAPAPIRVGKRAESTPLRGDGDARREPEHPPTPRTARHRLAEISLAPIQRCGCTKHYEKPRGD
ncbi:MAG: hypothetical protein AAGF23_22145 [Acidobacteriota bacterium]